MQIRLGILVALVVVIAGCGSDDHHNSFLKSSPSILSITGVPDVAVVGQATQLSAVLTVFGEAPKDVTAEAVWTSSDASVASVPPGGLLTPVAPGVVTIKASHGAVSASKNARVDAPPASALLISGSVPTLLIGQSRQLSVFLTVSGQLPKNITSEAEWSSSAPSVASVSSAGLVTAAGEGAATISVSFELQSASVSVRIDPPPPPPAVVTSLSIGGDLAFESSGTRQLKAIAGFNDGTTRDVTAETLWTSSNPAVADVLPGGMLRVLAFGAATTITGSFGGRTATLRVTVTFSRSGRVRLPQVSGYPVGVPGFTVTNTASGLSVITDSAGAYTVTGLTGPSLTRLTFEKQGFEPAEGLVGPNFGADILVQPVIRISVGETATTTIMAKDVSYFKPSFDCATCRLIRVVTPAAGTLHLDLKWTAAPEVLLLMWINGTVYTPAADIPVGPGETLVYIRSFQGAVVPLTLAASWR